MRLEDFLVDAQKANKSMRKHKKNERKKTRTATTTKHTTLLLQNEKATMVMITKTTNLWIGGTSGLSQSYFQAFGTTLTEPWVILGLEETRPAWLPSNLAYFSCDLTKNTKKLTEYVEMDRVNRVVVSIRPPLVTHRTNQQAWTYAQAMLHGLSVLLDTLPSRQVQQIIHISSIAAVDHHPRQSFFSEKDDSITSSQELSNPYDRFKRASEELITHWATTSDPPKSYTHLRFGAIFTDSPYCIQCQSLSLQARLGPLLAIPIDCNSGRNAATLLDLILRDEKKSLRPVYFYCRPLLYKQPVAYGTFLQAYRQAYDIRHYFTVPDQWVRMFVLGFHALTLFLGRWVPFLESIDYLFLVTLEEHSFDQRLVQQDFPELLSREESILECFIRRRTELFTAERNTRDKARRCS